MFATVCIARMFAGDPTGRPYSSHYFAGFTSVSSVLKGWSTRLSVVKNIWCDCLAIA